MKLWEVGARDAGDQALLALVEEYTVGDDYLIDRVLVPWDCYGSMAHGVMLERIGVLTGTELAALRAGLTEIVVLHRDGKFSLERRDEDCHTAIENYLVANVGEVGKKVHTGRSRNDQVLTALKLYMKGELFDLAMNLGALGRALLEFARSNPVPVPGYTHLQKAMPSTLALWAGSFAEGVCDTLRYLSDTIGLIDSSPLGSAAGYGVSLPLDREMTAKLLGFARVQRNVMYCQNMRGRNEVLVLGVLTHLALDLNKMATDLLFFSQDELGFVRLPAEFCTGSSIMPQKKNPDVLELMRAKAKEVVALQSQASLNVCDLPSGYNRDFQLSKKPLMRGFELVGLSVALATRLIQKLEVDAGRCRAACTPEVFATDMVYEQVKVGVSFRDAYRAVKAEGALGAALDPGPYIEAKRSTGAPGNLGLEVTKEELERLSTGLNSQGALFHDSLARLLPGVG
jgi:argininosuccinate lyase